MNISVLVPVYNEAGNIEQLHKELSGVLSGLSETYELIYINDGSSDETLHKINTFKESSAETVKVISFKRNYGQTAALNAGIRAALGDRIITIDGDGQNNPEDIPDMLSKMDHASADVVSGWRSPRKDGFLRVFLSQVANKLISLLCGLKLHDFGCSLKIYRSSCLKDLKLYGEMHRFIPAYVHWNGGKVIEQRVSHRKRSYGKSSYGLGRIYRVILDLFTMKFLTSYASKPIHIFGSAGLLSIFAGFLLAVFVFIRKVYFSGEYISPLFFISVFLMGIGMIMIFMGILAELSIRIYFAQTGILPYSIDEDI